MCILNARYIQDSKGIYTDIKHLQIKWTNHLLIDDIWNQCSRLLASVTQVTSDLDHMYLKQKSIYI